MYACKFCDVSTNSKSPVISSINVRKQHQTDIKLKADLMKDKTLPIYKIACPKCENDSCVGYMEKSEERALFFYYICTECFNEWSD